ncbi:hypothetical protein [Pyrobaculum islandicum]|uniref:hypothetical protein n=1 Tax=Pyrobaculum islandicum TaxID=2277 RepID=UPI00069D9592|nr:hypothetical protein [Pyrobaculum islandicum]
MDCNIEATEHLLAKHWDHIAKYVGTEFLTLLQEKAIHIYNSGKTIEVPERWRNVEKERRVTIIKYREKHFV